MTATFPSSYPIIFYSQTFSLTSNDALSTYVSNTPTTLLRKESFPPDLDEDVL
jgi:hypothetical protein